MYEILSRKDDTRNAELHDKIVETYERTSTARQPTRESFCLSRHTQNAMLDVYRWVGSGDHFAHLCVSLFL